MVLELHVYYSRKERNKTKYEKTDNSNELQGQSKAAPKHRKVQNKISKYLNIPNPNSNGMLRNRLHQPSVLLNVQ